MKKNYYALVHCSWFSAFFLQDAGLLKKKAALPGWNRRAQYPSRKKKNRHRRRRKEAQTCPHTPTQLRKYG